MLELHRCRLIDWSPSPVVALSPSIHGDCLAVARDSGDVEVWRVAAGSAGWACQLRIPGRKESAISSLVWILGNPLSPFGRLFSAGLDGHITEWDLGSLKPQAVVDSFGGPVWGMAVEPRIQTTLAKKRVSGNSRPEESDGNKSDAESEESGDESDEDSSREEGREKVERQREREREERIAVACDDGCIRLFHVDQPSGLHFIKAFPRVAGRILSVAWSTNGSRIFSGGSDGCIRCWDVTSRGEVYRMTVNASGSLRPDDLCVWALLVLRDDTLVSGDGSGCTQFWDERQGTLLQAHKRHKADVLALAAAPSHQNVFSAGIDGQVIQYHRVEKRKGEEASEGVAVGGAGPWAFVGARKFHTHDVRALAIAFPPATDEESSPVKNVSQAQRKKEAQKIPNVPMLISGGNDTQLFAYAADYFMQYLPHPVCPSPQIPYMQLTDGKTEYGKQLLMVQRPSSIDVWRLEEPGLRNSGTRGSGVHKEEEQLLEIEQKRIEGEHAVMGNGIGHPEVNKPRANGVLGKRKGGSGEIEEKMTKKAKGGSEKGGSEMGLSNGVQEKNSGLTENGKTDHSPVKSKPPVFLAQIKSNAVQHISCSAISPNGKLLAFSDWGKVRLYELEQTNSEQVSETGKRPCGIKKKKLPSGLPPSHKMVFTVDSTKLLLANRTGSILVVNVESSKIVDRFPSACPDLDSATSAQLPPAVTNMVVSLNGRWLGVTDSCGHISIYDLKNMRHHWVLPSPGATLPTALTFHPSRSELVVATASNEIHVLDVERKDFTPWSKKIEGKYPSVLLELQGGITGLSMSPNDKSDKLIVYGSRRMFHIDLSSPLPADTAEAPALQKNLKTEKPNRKNTNKPRKCELVGVDVTSVKGKEGGKEGELASESGRLQMVSFRNRVLFLQHLGDQSLLVVEKPWAEVAVKLPAPFYYHKYGT